MKTNRLVRIGLLCGLTVTSSGCSWLFVEGPPRVRPGQAMPAYAQCTESMALPNLDIAGAVISGLGAIGAIALANEADDDEQGAYTVAAVSNLAWAAIYGASASSGKSKVRGCRVFLATPVEPPTYLAADSVSWMPRDQTDTEKPLVPKRR